MFNKLIWMSGCVGLMAIVTTSASAQSPMCDPSTAGDPEADRNDICAQETRFDDGLQAYAQAEEACDTELSWQINWDSFPADWDFEWHPSGIVGHAQSVARGIQGACFDNYAPRAGRLIQVVRIEYAEEDDSCGLFDSRVSYDASSATLTVAFGKGFCLMDGETQRFVDDLIEADGCGGGADTGPMPGDMCAPYSNPDGEAFYNEWHDVCVEAPRFDAENMLPAVQEHCGTDLEASIDWASFGDRWCADFHAHGVVSTCSEILQRLGDVCFEGGDVASYIDRVRCHHVPVDQLPPSRDPSEDCTEPLVEYDEGTRTLSVGIGSNALNRCIFTPALRDAVESLPNGGPTTPRPMDPPADPTDPGAAAGCSAAGTPSGSAVPLLSLVALLLLRRRRR